MNILYINLANQIDRREFLESNVQANNNRLRAFVTFPFATTLSPYAENSQIQQARNIQEAVMNAFRRLMWLERDIDQATQTIDRVSLDAQDAETAAFLKILATVLSPRFPA